MYQLSVMIRERIRNIVYQKKMKILILKLVLISLLLSASKGSEGKSSKIMQRAQLGHKNHTWSKRVYLHFLNVCS